ncbi:MAG: hypothetical protein ACKO6B_05850 [Planctomycetia bacterium]
MTTDTAPTSGCRLLLAAAIVVAASSGCTSVIGSAYLREAWLDAVEHAAEATPRPKDGDKSTADDADSLPANDDAGAGQDDIETASQSQASWSPATLDEAVAEADQRLSRSGGLTEAARGTLVTMLEATPRQDWPVVIEEFTLALASVQGEGSKAADPGTPSPDTAPAPIAEPVAPLPPAAPAPAAAPEPPRPLTHVQPAQPTPGRAEPAPPAFAIRNACFASRVRAWGVVDRFETAEFSPGQEVIVYFELDQLSARQSTDGHTTRIDTALQLVDADGRRIHEWTFEPLEETCESRRHDYFARYLVTLPDALPAGSSRLEIVVSDTLAGRTAHATLPLALAGR